MKRLIIFVLIVSCFTAVLYAEKLTGSQILDKIDKNYESETSISVSVMKIKGRRGTRTMKAKQSSSAAKTGPGDSRSP